MPQTGGTPILLLGACGLSTVNKITFDFLTLCRTADEFVFLCLFEMGHANSRHSTGAARSKSTGASCLIGFRKATYFITFRLVDSLPAEKLRELERLSDQWELDHPPPRTEDDWQQFFRQNMQRVDDWLDAGSGECWLRHPQCARIVGNSLHHFHGSRCFLSSYCVMPNHVHVLVKPEAPDEPADLLHSWKGFAAKEINKVLGREGPVWEPESYDTLVRDSEHLWKVIRYVGKNPGKAGVPPGEWVRYIHPEWEKASWGFEAARGG